MKVVVAQIGARRAYAVPAVLARAGLLERFYTDICASRGLGRLLSWLAPLARGQPRAALQRLAERRLPASLKPRTVTFGYEAARHLWRSRFAAHDPAAGFEQTLAYGWRLGHAMARAGLGQGTHLYSMLMEPGPLLAHARQRGLTVVAEIYILLSSERIVREERQRFPAWEEDQGPWPQIAKRFYPRDPLLSEMHFALCPSDAVRDDLVQRFGFPQSRTAVVPYGVGPAWFQLQPAPRPGRILFAGTACLRKGIQYLAQAAQLLRAHGRNYEFLIAGDAPERVRRQPECRALTFLGRLAQPELAEQFRQANLLVAPSLAEGSAEVTYQALAAGLPLVATAAAGSVARNQREALIVPARDPAALAEAIELLVENRGLRNALAAAARQRARDFTWERYGQRLIQALRSFPSRNAEQEAEPAQALAPSAPLTP